MRTYDGNHKGEGTEETDIGAHGKKEMKGYMNWTEPQIP